jgi:hypothetical protein
VIPEDRARLNYSALTPYLPYGIAGGTLPGRPDLHGALAPHSPRVRVREADRRGQRSVNFAALLFS